MVEIMTLLSEEAGQRHKFQDELSTDGNQRLSSVRREKIKFALEKAVVTFIEDYQVDGVDILRIKVDSSKWHDGKEPGAWFRAADAVTIVLLEYGVLQAAGFSVASEERE